MNCRFPRRSLAALAGAAIFSAAGCMKRDAFEVAPAHGTVTCNGKPLTRGLIEFKPVPRPDTSSAVPGRPAYAMVQPDGTFVLHTYGTDDGAIVGLHLVRVITADRDEPGAKRIPCESAAAVEVKINPGVNEVKVELSGR